MNDANYRVLILKIIDTAIRDADVDFFHSAWFTAMVESLGYSSNSARELALEKIRRRMVEDADNGD